MCVCVCVCVCVCACVHVCVRVRNELEVCTMLAYPHISLVRTMPMYTHKLSTRTHMHLHTISGQPTDGAKSGYCPTITHIYTDMYTHMHTLSSLSLIKTKSSLVVQT